MRYVGITLVLGLLLSACSSMESGSTCLVDESYFANEKTFAWSPDMSGQVYDHTHAIGPVTVELIRKEIERQLIERGGYFSDDPEFADVLVSFVVATREEIDQGGYDRYWWGVYRGGMHADMSTISAHTEAFLAVDLYEAESGLPLWRGWAQHPVGKRDRNDPAPIIREAITSVLDHLPGGALPGG